MRESRTYGSVRAKAEWLSYSTNISAAVAAFISGAAGLYTAAHTEKVRYGLTVRQEKMKKLGEAHEEMLKIRQTAKFDKRIKSNPMEFLNDVTNAMQENYLIAEAVYLRVRPLLDRSEREKLENQYATAQKLSAEVFKKLVDGGVQDKGTTPLELLEAREGFINRLKDIVEVTYEKASSGG